jgi:hypothetical protein
VSRRALLLFWVAVPLVVIAALGFFLSARDSNVKFGWAALTALAAVALLGAISRLVRRIHIETRGEASVDDAIEHFVQQLDDRFAVFQHARVGTTWIDRLIVGPSGCYAVHTAEAPNVDGNPKTGDVERVMEMRKAIRAVVAKVAPSTRADIEAVICVGGAKGFPAQQGRDGLWLVPADGIAAALLKRSGREGAISTGVDITGAFSTDMVRVRALETALAAYWKVTPRRTLQDYLAPQELTGKS